MARPRGFATWSPKAETVKLLEQVQAVLAEYKDFLPVTARQVFYRHPPMSGFGWDYPPGVTGNEPQITGEWPCGNCGAKLPEEADCPECGAHLDVSPEDGDWVCGSCGWTGEAGLCVGGCREVEVDELAGRE